MVWFVGESMVVVFEDSFAPTFVDLVGAFDVAEPAIDVLALGTTDPIDWSSCCSEENSGQILV